MFGFSRKRPSSDMDPEAIIADIEATRKKQFERRLPKGETYESAKAKEVERLGSLFAYLKSYVNYLVSSEKDILLEVESLKTQTQQNVLESVLIQELWSLRYAALHIWFFDFDGPKNQNELDADYSLIKKAFNDVLDERGKSEYREFLTEALVMYTGSTKIQFKELKRLKSYFVKAVAEKIPRITFDATEGRLGGELHDGVMGLIMKTVESDHTVFGGNA